MNYKEEQTNAKATNLENENSTENQKGEDNIKELSENTKLDEELIEINDEYKFGWSCYSEKTNGRFAMIGFIAIIVIEIFSQQSFLKWAGIL